MSQGASVSLKRDRNNGENHVVPLRARLVFLLDTSGSMEGSEDAMVEAINAHIQQVDQEVDDLVYIIYTFTDDRVFVLQRLIFDGQKRGLELLTREQYTCGGSTALFDNLCDTIQEEKNCTIILATDGDDTASWRYSMDETKDLISEAIETKGITFKFIAEGIDAQKTLASISQREEDVICAQDGLAVALSEPSFIQACSQSLIVDDYLEPPEKMFKTQNSPAL